MKLKRLIINAIKSALVLSEGNKSAAAEFLGISLRTVRNYVREHEELKPWYMKPRGKPMIRRDFKTKEEALAFIKTKKVWLFAEKEERKEILNTIEWLYS